MDIPWALQTLSVKIQNSCIHGKEKIKFIVRPSDSVREQYAQTVRVNSSSSVLAVAGISINDESRLVGVQEIRGCLFYGPHRANFCFGTTLDLENFSTNEIQK